ncbi:unnamed protein product [Linum tenue]|uniref:Uncharacterized protein n=1 Tax=Linum tenue TaxID=586396 RepID=A0AAV0IDF4_9ROSI|nr:unnamed protein product [Linum tenue]
MWSSSTELH